MKLHVYTTVALIHDIFINDLAISLHYVDTDSVYARLLGNKLNVQTMIYQWKVNSFDCK